MATTDKRTAAAKPEVTAEEMNLDQTPGFHVLSEDVFLGTYPTEADAQAFIDGQLVPQDLTGKIIEGPAA